MLLGNDYYYSQGSCNWTWGTGYSCQIGLVCEGKVITKTEVVSEPTMFVSIVCATPINMWITTYMLPSVDPCIDAKSSIKLFLIWELEYLGITESPSASKDDVALDQFNSTVKFVDGRYIVTWP